MPIRLYKAMYRREFEFKRKMHSTIYIHLSLSSWIRGSFSKGHGKFLVFHPPPLDCFEYETCDPHALLVTGVATLRLFHQQEHHHHRNLKYARKVKKSPLCKWMHARKFLMAATGARSPALFALWMWWCAHVLERIKSESHPSLWPCLKNSIAPCVCVLKLGRNEKKHVPPPAHNICHLRFGDLQTPLRVTYV